LTRLVHFLVRNWPLKVAAVALASLLYAGRILSADTGVLRSRIPVLWEHQPATTVVTQAPADIQVVRYVAPPGTGQLTPDDFRATVDLANVQPDGNPTNVGITVSPLDPRVTVIGVEPSQSQVVLERLQQKTVPVQIQLGDVPTGLAVGQKTATPSSVEVSGPTSVIDRVVAARVLVPVESSELDVHKEARPAPIDASGQVITDRVEVKPETVQVDVTVQGDQSTRTLPVNPVVTGVPPPGFRLSKVTADPQSVVVKGDADAISTLTQADTQPIQLSGITSEVKIPIPLALPEGVTAPSVDKINVTIAVEPVQETRTYSAGLRLDGARPDRRYQVQTDKVLLTVFGPIGELDQLGAGPLVVGLNVSGIEPGTRTVPVVPNLPAGVNLADVSPRTVTVVVTPVASASPVGSPAASASP